MTARIADAGFIIALNSPDAAERKWARAALERWTAPFLTCEGGLVRMSELFPDCRVFSVDGDFNVYRRFRDQPIPTVYPPDLDVS